MKTAFDNKFSLSIDFSSFFGTNGSLPENEVINYKGNTYTILNYKEIDNYYSKFKNLVRAFFAIGIISINLRNFFNLIGQGGGSFDNSSDS